MFASPVAAYQQSRLHMPTFTTVEIPNQNMCRESKSRVLNYHGNKGHFLYS